MMSVLMYVDSRVVRIQKLGVENKITVWPGKGSAFATDELCS